jgi:hypothetical protein
MFYILSGRVKGNLGSLASSCASAFILLIDLFFLLYALIFLIPTLGLISHIPDVKKELIIVCFYMVC